MNYRPEGWLDIHINYDECLHDWVHVRDLKNGEREFVEAGADAMLKALRKEGTHFDKEEWTDDSSFETEVPGTVVFIPDEYASPV